MIDWVRVRVRVRVKTCGLCDGGGQVYGTRQRGQTDDPISIAGMSDLRGDHGGHHEGNQQLIVHLGE